MRDPMEKAVDRAVLLGQIATENEGKPSLHLFCAGLHRG
jgi:hypothetical protein